ncbi:MAG: hypothetical protein U1E83_11630 [Methylotetracoccus sp.]
MIKNIGPLAWAYCILLGGVLLLTPGGIIPIVTKILGIIGIAIGSFGFLSQSGKFAAR